MTSPLALGFIQGIFRKWRGTAIEWLDIHFRIPHSARATKFDGDNAPHLREVIEACCSMSLRKVVFRACTGAGKTTVMEAVSTFAVAVEPGPMLIVGQNDNEIQTWAKTRLKGCLNACAVIKELMKGMGRFDDTKDLIAFPHMDLHLSGANISGLQEKSMRYCYGDETWTWKKGMIGEMLARHHDRWNRKTILVSQGWETNEETPHDMDEQYGEGDDRRAGFTCPKCEGWNQYKFSQIKYEKIMIPELEDIDYNATSKTAHYVCENEECREKFQDTSASRRKLADSLTYRAFSSHPMDMVTSFTCPAWAVWWISWGDLVVEWLKANAAKKSGDIELLKKFTMKRAAENWSEEYSKVSDDAVMGLRADFYKRGECPIDPVFVGMFADPGKSATHWSVSAWAETGEHYVLDYGIVAGMDDLFPLAQSLKYPIKGTDKHATIINGLIDSGDFTEDVYHFCLKSNVCGSLLFFPSKGSGVMEGIKPWKETILENYAKLPLYIYVDRYAKDELYGRKIAQKESPRLWVPSDASMGFLQGLMGQRKIGDQWQKVAQDHIGDTVKLATVFWWIMKKFVGQKA